MKSFLGKADLRQDRNITISPKEYIKHLLQYKDQRFSKNPRFIFWSLNTLMRWQTLSNSTICLKNSQIKNFSIEDIKKRLKKIQNF